MKRIITFFDASGSGYQALFGVNAALSLSLQLKEPVALLDLAPPEIREVASLLNTPPARTITDILLLLDTLDTTMLSSYLALHTSGVTFIGEREKTFSDTRIAPHHIGRIIDGIAHCFPWVIINAPTANEEHLSCIFECSDYVVMPVLSHLLSVHKARAFLERFRSWHFPISMVKLLVLQLHGPGSLHRDTISDILNIPIYAEIPFSQETVAPSINSGEPMATAAPHTEFSLKIKELSARIASENFVPRKKNNMRSITPAAPSLRALKREIHKELIEKLQLHSRGNGTGGPHEQPASVLRNKARETLQLLLSNRDVNLSREERGNLIEELLNDALGFGCIEPFLNAPEITEIMINGPERIFVEREGKIERTDAHFDSPEQLRTIADRMVAPIGRRVDESSPLVDARLPDGSRVNIIIPPLSLDGPSITIRKFARNRLLMDDLIARNTLSHEMAEFLRVCVQAKKNILIAGGTGSGKTTLLNVLAAYITEHERIITIEDSAELRLTQEHVVRLEARPVSMEGTGEIPIRRLVINSLRMRPDRIVVGECRGGEALDMLQAMNTGHDGSLTTIHANSTKDSIMRLTTMAMMSGMELPERTIKEQIASAIHCIVQLQRLPDGTRKITEIAEIIKTANGDTGVIPVFVFEQSSYAGGTVLGTHRPTGSIPSFIEQMEKHGISIDKNIFNFRQGPHASSH